MYFAPGLWWKTNKMGCYCRCFPPPSSSWKPLFGSNPNQDDLYLRSIKKYINKNKSLGLLLRQCELNLPVAGVGGVNGLPLRRPAGPFWRPLLAAPDADAVRLITKENSINSEVLKLSVRQLLQLRSRFPSSLLLSGHRLESLPLESCWDCTLCRSSEPLASSVSFLICC